MYDAFLNQYREELRDVLHRYGGNGTASGSLAELAHALNQVRTAWQNAPWIGGAASAHGHKISQAHQACSTLIEHFETVVGGIANYEPEVVSQADWRSVFTGPAIRLG